MLQRNEMGKSKRFKEVDSSFTQKERTVSPSKLKCGSGYPEMLPERILRTVAVHVKITNTFSICNYIENNTLLALEIKNCYFFCKLPAYFIPPYI